MKLKIIKFDSVKSTNDEAINLINQNYLRPTLIISQYQTKGRGTMGKKWISKKGNFFISIYFEVDSKNDFKKFAILNPYIIHRILKKYSKYKVQIKWPNDLLIKKKKVCGILQETIEFEKKNYLIIGIGINTLESVFSKKFKSIALTDCTTKIVNNNNLLKDFKKAYDKLIFNISKYSISYVEKKFLKKV